MRTIDYPAIGERMWCGSITGGPELRILRKSGWNRITALYAVDFGGADPVLPGPEETGIPAGAAHYLEHKLFDMPEGNASNTLAALGADNNAFTTEDMTAYYISCTGRFEESFREFLRFVSTPWFTAETVEKERGIILQEARMYADDPCDAAEMGLMRLLFRHSPLREDIVGTEESIRAVTPEILAACYRSFYVPGRTVLCVVGDVEPERVAALAEEGFPKRLGQTPEYRRKTERPAKPRRKYDAVSMEVGAPRFALGCRLSPLEGPALLRRRLAGEAALEMLAGQASPVYRELYDAGLIDASFSWQLRQAAGESLVLFTGNGKDPAAVARALAKGAAELAETPDPEAFRRAVRTGLGNQLRELNSFTDLCYNIAQGCFGGYDPLTAASLLPRLEAGEAARFLAELTYDSFAAFSVEPLNTQEIR